MTTALDAQHCDVLRASGWLASQTSAFQQALLARCRLQRFARGAVIYRRGEPAGGVYGLVEGSLAYVFPQAESEAHLVHVGLPGSWIGEAAVLLNAPRAITLKALAPSTVACLSRRSFDELVAEDPSAWRAFAVLAAAHQTMAARVISDLLPQTALVRVAGRILGLAMQEFPDLTRAEGAVVPITQSELASMIGLSRPTVNQLLRRLDALGFVEASYGKIRILSVDGLNRVLDAEL